MKSLKLGQLRTKCGKGFHKVGKACLYYVPHAVKFYPQSFYKYVFCNLI